MRILLGNDSGLAHFYERIGLLRAFVACGHEAVIWDYSKKSAFDAFDDFEPDLFITQTYNLNDAIVDCILERPALKVYAKSGDWGHKTTEISAKYPVLVATDQEKELVLKLKKQCNKPDFVCVHHHHDYLKDTHGYWDENGIKSVSVMNAADIFEYTKGNKQKKYECQLAFCGGFWGYKSQILNEWFLPLCSNFKYSIKIFGNQSWPVPQYHGFINDNEVKHLFSSAQICPNFHEPHSHEYHYDIVERPFKLASNKSFIISDYVGGLEKLFGDSLVMAKTPQEFKEKVDYFLDNPKEKERYVEEMYNKVINNHTYFSRVTQVLIELGLEEEAEKSIEKRKDVFERMDL